MLLQRFRGNLDSWDPALVTLAEGPVAGDEVVVEEDGARVFLGPAVAAVLDSKSLDAQVNEQGQVSFSLSERAAS